jgi:aminoglycoside phosphotransferase (APT) family kinase protein
MNDEIVAGVTRDALAALLERHGLGPLRSVTPIDGGAASQMLRVNDDLVLRLNGRDPHLPRLTWERHIYERLRRAGVPVPGVLALDTQRDLVPFDALLLNYVDGVSGASVWASLDAEAKAHVSEELGRISAASHALNWPSYGRFVGVADDDMRSDRWTDVITHRVIDVYGRVAQRDLLPPRVLDALVTTFNDGDALYAGASTPTLVHTDLWLGNVLLHHDRGHWHVMAVLDWEWAFVADDAWEFATMWRDNDPWPLAESFMRGYRERRPLPPDWRVRQRLYRLLDTLERVASSAEQGGAESDTTQFFVARLTQLLQRQYRS